MTIQAILRKLKKYWYIIVVFVLIGGYFSLQQATQDIYNANVVIGLNPASGGAENSDETVAVFYNRATIFLSQLFETPLIQAEILDKIDESHTNIPNLGAFYTVTPLDLGYINIAYSSTSQEKAEEFVDAVNDIYATQVVSLWNEQKPVEFGTQPSESLTSKIVKTRQSSQQTILPLVASILAGFLIVVFVPEHTNKKSK